MYEIYQGISHPGCIPAYPGYGYMHRDLYQTITSSHLVLHTKPGRIKNFKLSGVTRQVETTGAQLLDNNSYTTRFAEVIKNTPEEIEIKNNEIYDSQLIRAIVFKAPKSQFKSGNITFSTDYVHTGNLSDVGYFTASLYWGNDGSPAAKNIKKVVDTSQNGKMEFTAQLAQEDIDNIDYTYMFVWLYCQSRASEGILYTSGLTLRYPMLYQDGDGTWEPYTGATSSPSPEYPQNIQGVGVRTAQLANLPDIAPTTSNGLTWSCKDGVITVTGTAQKNSDSTTVGLYAELHLQPGTYTVSGYDPDVEVYVRITRADDKTIYYQKSPFVAEATDKLTIIYVQVPIGKTVNKTIYPMLNAGTSALPFEPYGYRTDVVTRSKNLVNISMISPTYQQIPNGFVLDAATDGRRIARMPCQLQAGVEYAYKFRCHYNMPGHLVDLYLPKIKQYFVENRDGDIIFGTFIPTADTDTFSVYFQSEAAGTGVTAEITELQVEEGSTPTSYQPYAYYTAPIYTREPLTQWDHLEYRNGEYGVVKKSAVVVEDGSRNVDDTHYPILFFSTLAKPMNVDAKVYCNYCSSERIGRLSILGKNICINSADTYWGFANAPECKAWLTQKNAEGKPLYYCYETVEESWEPIPAISQQALRNLPTYKGTTIIDTTDPLEPEITVSYLPQKKNFFNPEKVFSNPVPGATRYFKYDLGLSPGSYRWNLQKNEFLGSGQYVLFTDDLEYEGSSIDSGKIYQWIGHSTLANFCFTSGAFSVTSEMYMALYSSSTDTVKQLLKTLIIEKI